MKWKDPILMEEKNMGIIPYLCQYYQSDIDFNILQQKIKQTFEIIDITPREYLDLYTTPYKDPYSPSRIKYGLPITFCIDYNLDEVLEFLFTEYNMNPNPERMIDSMPFLSRACINGNKKIVELLINAYKKNEYDIQEFVNQYNYFDLQNDPYSYPLKTSLIYSAIYNHHEIVKLLIENGADPQTTDENGYTAFDYTFHNPKTKNLDIAAMVSHSCYDFILLKWTKVKMYFLHMNNIIYPEDQNTWTVRNPDDLLPSQNHKVPIPKLNLAIVGEYNIEDIT